MKVQDAHRVRQAADRLAAAISELDLGSMLPTTHQELVALGERIERTGRTVKALAAAKVAESAVWRGDGDRSAEDWLTRTTGTTRAEAAKELQCGRDLHWYPRWPAPRRPGSCPFARPKRSPGRPQSTPPRPAGCWPALEARACASCKTSAAPPAATPTLIPTPPEPGSTPAARTARGPTLMAPAISTSRAPPMSSPGSTTPCAIAATASSATHGATVAANPPTPTPSTLPPSSSPRAAMLRRCPRVLTPRSSCGSTSRSPPRSCG